MGIAIFQIFIWGGISSEIRSQITFYVKPPHTCADPESARGGPTLIFFLVDDGRDDQPVQMRSLIRALLVARIFYECYI